MSANTAMAVEPVTMPAMRPLAMARWLGGYARRRSGGLALLLVAMVAKVFVDILRPWPTKLIVDLALGAEPLPAAVAGLAVVLPGASSREGLIAWCVVATVAIFLLGWLLAAALAVASATYGRQLSYDLAADLFARLQRLSLRFHRRGSAGDAIRRVLVDSTCVSTIVKDAALPLVTALVTLAAMFVVLWRLNPPVALAALAVVPMMAWVLWHYAGPMTRTSYAQQHADARIYETVERTLAALPAIQAYGREAATDRAFRDVEDRTLAAALMATDVQLRFKILIGLSTAIGTAAIVWIGAHQVLAGTLTTGGLLVTLAYLGSLYAPLATLAFTTSTVQSAAASAQRALEIWQTEPEPRNQPHAVSVRRVRGGIRFDAVTTGYDQSRAVLREITFTAPAGSTIAIVGETGAGKSTLVSLIPRFLDPWSGAVRLDGYDLRNLTLDSVRRHVSLVLQETYLFPTSIAANIAYARPDASRTDIEAAARIAYAHDFISRLPSGYDTVIGERGATLSGGERQRLAIARAVLKNAPVLILDEPTASLDVLTESDLLDAMRRLMRDRTTIVIAHRLSTVRAADLILVLDAGSIIETGTHDSLVAGGGHYAQLSARQFAAQSPPPSATASRQGR